MLYDILGFRKNLWGFFLLWRTIWMPLSSCKMELVHIERLQYLISWMNILVSEPWITTCIQKWHDMIPYSPDLTPCNIFLWGYLKDLVYRQTPQAIAELKQQICTACKTISRDMFELSGQFFLQTAPGCCRKWGLPWKCHCLVFCNSPCKIFISVLFFIIFRSPLGENVNCIWNVLG